MIKHKTQLDYLNPTWDSMNHIKRETIALEQLVATALFAKHQVPFYKELFKPYSDNYFIDLESMDQFALEVPETTKLDVSTNTTKNTFIPLENYREMDPDLGEWLNWGTGGTTGRPTIVLHSKQDFRGITRVFASSMMFDWEDHLESFKGNTVIGLYHGDHVTNWIYRTAFSLLGMNFHSRPSTKLNPHEVYDFIQQVKPNAILGPPEDMSGKLTKGMTVDTIMKIDARQQNAEWRLSYKDNPEFNMIHWSSAPISKDLHNYWKNHLQIPFLMSHYGNTEVCSVGNTCFEHPTDFHLTFRTSSVAVKSMDGKKIAQEGEDGYMLFSKTGALTQDNELIVPTGMIVLNYRPGDAGRLIQTNGYKCKCGRNTPVLKNLHRFEYKAGNLSHGCQAD